MVTLKSQILDIKNTSITKSLIEEYGYTKSQAKYLISLIKKNIFSEETIDESIADSREISTLYKNGAMPWSYVIYNARKYRW